MKICIYFLLLLSLFFYGCSGSVEGIIEAPAEVSKEALHKVLNNTEMTFEISSSDALLLESDSLSELGTYFLVSRQGTNPMNNTGTTGIISLSPYSPGETLYKAEFSTPAGDPAANANLFLQMTKQQINLDNGLQQPFDNPQKSGLTYTLLTFVSPFLSTNYLMENNPLISQSNHKWLYVQNGMGDLAMAGLFIAGAFANDRQSDYFWGGFAISLIWKLFSLFNLTDLTDYNRIAATQYNLSRIKAE